MQTPPDVRSDDGIRSEDDVKSSSLWRRFRKHKVAMIGGFILTALVLMAVFAPYVAPNDPYDQRLDLSYGGPSWEHPLGLDRIGRCNLSRLIFASRISLSVGVISAGVSMTIGVFLGSIAGYYGGTTDHVLSRIADAMLSLPAIVIIMTLVFVLGTHILNIMVVIGLLGWVGIFRLVRGQILSLREREFYLAAIASGAPPTRIMAKHLIPNSLSPVIVAVTLRTAASILTESTLSFLGFGIQPPLASWGSTLSAAQSLTILTLYPFLWVPPGIAIAVTVLSINFVGDGLRDALDPRAQLRVK